MKTIALALALLATTANAQTDVWHDLLRALQIADITKARLEFDCKNDPRYSSVVRLSALCEKRHRIPDQVIEDAALPFLQKHLSESMARRALAQVSEATWQSVGRKLTIEIRTGKRDQLTPEDIAFLEEQNQSEVGTALKELAADKSQGIAIGKAMLDY